MKPADYDSFVEVVVGFAELRGKQLSAAGIKLYWNAMQDWTLAEFKEAANHLVKTCEWMPSPHHFEELRKAGRMTAGEAWKRALEHCTGSWRNGQGCGDSKVDEVVRMLGGYEVVALCHHDKLGFLERRFAEHYEALQDATDTRGALPSITDDSPKRLQ